jgi:hypothetical protein
VQTSAVQQSQRSSSIVNTRAAVIIAAVIVFVATIACLTAAEARLTAFAVLMSDGLLAAGWTAGACALGAVVLRLFRIQSNRPLFVATAAGVGLGIFSLLALGLGLIGSLNRITATAMPIAGVVLLAVDLLRRHREFNVEAELKRWMLAPAGLSWLWLVPVASLAIACLAASVMPGVLWKPMDPHPYDVVSYHLQVPREWYELGRIVPLRHNVFSFFPFNAEMQYLLLMHAAGGPWRAMYACQFMSVMCAVVMMLAIIGAVDDRKTGVVAAALAAVVPWTVMLAGVAYVETSLMLYTTLAVAWCMRACASREPSGSAAGRPRQPENVVRAMILAGVIAGFACGVKITAVPMLLLALPIAVLLTGGFSRQVFIACIVFVIAGVLALSPWLIRNVVWCGNPIFPVATKIFGKAYFSDGQIERFRIAHSPTPDQASPVARLRVTWLDVIAHWQFGYILLPAALVAAAVRRRDRQTWLLLITAVIIFIVWIGFTHLLGRFLVMFIPIGAILIGRLQWGRARPAAVALVAVAAALGWPGVVSKLSEITLDQTRSALIGREDLAFMVPPELSEMSASDKQIGLVGDAQPFLYQVPMSRLHYRTVFDIPPGETDPIDAWVGAEAKGNPNWLLVINPTEIERLHRTYFDVPGLRPEWVQRGPEPFVVRGDQSK